MDPMGILNIIKSSTRLSWKKRSSWWCALAPAWKRIQPHGWRKWYLEHVPTDELSTSVVTVCFLSVYYVWITYDYCKIKKTQFAKSWPVYSVQSWNSLSQCEKKHIKWCIMSPYPTFFCREYTPKVDHDDGGSHQVGVDKTDETKCLPKRNWKWFNSNL